MKMLWAIAIAMIVLVGIKLTIKLRFIQFNLIKMFKSIFIKDDSGSKLLNTLFLTLGGRIGVGSVAGVALAIYIAGPGTIFWMWVSAIICASITYGETILGMKYKVKENDNYIGGAPYYIKQCLSKKVAIIYSIIIIISYVGGFISIQANTITKSINEVYNINPYLIAIILSLVSLFIIWGGIKKISSAINKIVPFMLIVYLLCGLFVFIKEFDKIPMFFNQIITSAFELKSLIGVLIVGVQRGIFSNEAGLGTGSISSSTSSIKKIENNGYIQMLGIYITTLLVCTVTAFIVMSFNYQGINLTDINGIELTMQAFNYHMGYFGNIIMIFCIILFSFSTILTGYYYGETCLKFMMKSQNKMIVALKLMTILVVFYGAVASSTKLWGIVDFLVSLLAIINVCAIGKLINEITT